MSGLDLLVSLDIDDATDSRHDDHDEYANTLETSEKRRRELINLFKIDNITISFLFIISVCILHTQYTKRRDTLFDVDRDAMIEKNMEIISLI